MDNSTIWNEIYETSDFGNKYPSSYLVSLFHSRIKPLCPPHKMNVLDFGCSVGANSAVFKDLKMNTYGIEISKKAVDYIIKKGIGDEIHFKAINLLESGVELCDIFPNVQFDFIIASEIMYYFKNSERNLLIDKLMKSMNKDAIIYVSMPTYDFPLYKDYKNIAKDKDGMVEVKESGRIKNSLRVNLPTSKIEMERMFSPFKVIDIITVNMPLNSNEDMIEYHMIARK